MCLGSCAVSVMPGAEQSGERVDGLEQQRADAGLLVGGVMGLVFGDGAVVLGLGGELAHPGSDSGDACAARSSLAGRGQSRVSSATAFLGAGIVDEVLAVGGGRDERGDSGVVERAREPVGHAVQPGGRVVGEQRLLAAGRVPGDA